MFRLLAVSVLVLAWSCGNSTAAAADLGELLKFVPDDANVLMIVRVQDILQSPRAAKEGWAKQQEDAWLAGAEAIPPFLNDMIRATRLHLEDSSISWSIGLAHTVPPASLQKIADHHSGAIERIGKTQVVKTQKDSYFSVLGPKIVGVFSPAYRQDTGRWLRYAATNKESRLGEYLAGAAKNPAPIVIAIDATDMLDPQSLKGWLGGTKALEGKANKVNAVANIYNYLRGITLAVQIADETTMQLTLDFGVAVGSSSVEVKQTLIEYLEDSGAAFGDLDQAVVTAKGQSVTLTAPLTDVGLRRLFSILVTPNPAIAQSASPTPPVPQADVDAKQAKAASQRYFQTIDQMIEDLSNKASRGTNYEKTAAWHDSYAKKIDSLSLKNVDPALAEYARTQSQRLRALAASLRGVSLRLSNAQGQLVVDYSVDPGQVGGWGPGAYWGGAAMYTPPTWRATSNLEQVRQKQAEAIEKGSDERSQIWQAIEGDRQTIRQKMLDTFGEDFAQPR